MKNTLRYEYIIRFVSMWHCWQKRKFSTAHSVGIKKTVTQLVFHRSRVIIQIKSSCLEHTVFAFSQNVFRSKTNGKFDFLEWFIIKTLICFSLLPPPPPHTLLLTVNLSTNRPYSYTYISIQSFIFLFIKF